MNKGNAMTEYAAPLLQVINLELYYGDLPAIKNLSLEIPAGSFVGLIGPNGAGKTTLMMSLSGQFRPTDGKILHYGKDIYSYNLEYKRGIGYVHEQPFFYPYLTVEDYLNFVAEVKQVSVEQAEVQIESLLRMLNLVDHRDKLSSALSQGMSKKLAIAAAILGDPQILFLDEALNGIDIESSYLIKKKLKEYVSRGGTVILSTHILEVIEKVCDRYLVLQNGRFLADLLADQYEQWNTESLEEYIIHLLNVKN